MYPIIVYLVALILTIVIEIIVAFFFKLRNKDAIVTIVLINIVTHPLIHYSIAILFAIGIAADYLVVLLLEIAVIIAEWRLLVYSLQDNSKQMLVLSIIMNMVSYAIGLLIFY
jgi:hypothetical protein